MNIQHDWGQKPAFTRLIENLKPVEELSSEAFPSREPRRYREPGYRINSSIQMRLRFNLARNPRVARLKSAVELFIFRFGRWYYKWRTRGGGHIAARSCCLCNLRNFGTRNFAEHLRGLESRDTQRTRRSSLSHSPGGYLYELGLSQPCNRRPLYRWTFTTADGQC